MGLQPPSIVTEATDEYFASQDSLAEWVRTQCERVADTWTTTRTLFSDWKAWMLERGEEPGTEKAFSDAMVKHAPKGRKNVGVVFVGIRLLAFQHGAEVTSVGCVGFYDYTVTRTTPARINGDNGRPYTPYTFRAGLSSNKRSTPLATDASVPRPLRFDAAHARRIMVGRRHRPPFRDTFFRDINTSRAQAAH